jgi:hypothetical protein
MKRLVIFASSKGGVGKSYASRAFVDLARRAGRRVSAWDLDSGTGSLARLYPDRNPEVGADVEDVRDPEAPGRWLDAMCGDSDDVVLDVPGGALANLVRVFVGGAPSLVSEAKSLGREVVLVSVIGVKYDSATAPQDAIELFGGDVRHIALKNGFFGESSKFVIFDGIRVEGSHGRKYGKTSDAVREVGGEVLYLPKLDTLTDVLLDVEGLSFAAAAAAGALVGRRYSMNARLWLGLVETAFAGSWLDTSGAVPGMAPSLNGKAGRPRNVSVGV